MFKKTLLYLIKIYQKTISPDHGIFSEITIYKCKYFPTCSEYTYQAISKYGILKGASKGVFRILRCNPFSKGGVDLP
ncbi:MAG: membrane protein insertion efficiency factor YidD [Patescibacteria group bacterium]